MNLILLSGNSLPNEAWIDQVASSFKDSANVLVHRYRHWKTGEAVIDLDHELAELAESITQFDQYSIFAKSAGTLLAMKGVHEGVLHPAKCVFVGVPINWAREQKFDLGEWLSDYQVPTLFIQQVDDPYATFDELKSFIENAKHPSASFASRPGNDHQYADIDAVKKLTFDFL